MGRTLKLECLATTGNSARCIAVQHVKVVQVRFSGSHKIWKPNQPLELGTGRGQWGKLKENIYGNEILQLGNLLLTSNRRKGHNSFVI